MDSLATPTLDNEDVLVSYRCSYCGVHTQVRRGPRSGDEQPNMWAELSVNLLICTLVSPFANLPNSTSPGLWPKKSHIRSTSSGWEEPENICVCLMVIVEVEAREVEERGRGKRGRERGVERER
jgi:hypothetical protein